MEGFFFLNTELGLTQKLHDLLTVSWTRFTQVRIGKAGHWKAANKGSSFPEKQDKEEFFLLTGKSFLKRIPAYGTW